MWHICLLSIQRQPLFLLDKYASPLPHSSSLPLPISFTTVSLPILTQTCPSSSSKNDTSKVICYWFLLAQAESNHFNFSSSLNKNISVKIGVWIWFVYNPVFRRKPSLCEGLLQHCGWTHEHTTAVVSKVPSRFGVFKCMCNKQSLILVAEMSGNWFIYWNMSDVIVSTPLNKMIPLTPAATTVHSHAMRGEA